MPTRTPAAFVAAPLAPEVATMRELLPLASRAGVLLAARRETVAVAESAAGGLISATILAVPGASAWYRGGWVMYTRDVLLSLRDIDQGTLRGLRAATEPYAAFCARTAHDRLQANWGLAETGAAGPTGNRYGDPAGHACVAVHGAVERHRTIATGSSDRVENMHAFASAALLLLIDTLENIR
jgi:PncC family amidohydrolase